MRKMSLINPTKGDLEKSFLIDLKTKHQRQLKILVIIGLIGFVTHTVVLLVIALNIQKNIVEDILKLSK